MAALVLLFSVITILKIEIKKYFFVYFYHFVNKLLSPYTLTRSYCFTHKINNTIHKNLNTKIFYTGL